MNSNHLPVSGGIAVVLAVLISYFVLEPVSLENMRPASEGSHIAQVHGLEDVQARLWQDPFAAVESHADLQSKPTASVQVSGVIAMPSQSGKQGAVEMRLLQADSPLPKPTSEESRHTLATLTGEIDKKAAKEAEKEKKDTIAILAVMVSAGPYAKQAEARLRMRYAVVSGLGTEGFWPKDAEHIGFVNDLNKATSIVNNNKGKHRLDLSDGEDQLPSLMPYEWYESAGDARHVLLLWLDNDAFTNRPLAKLELLLHALGKHAGSIKLIGPAGSGTLKAMVQEARKAASFETLRTKVDAYSAMATATEEELTGDDSWVDVILSGNVFRHFARAIATDDLLAKKLVDELKLRMPPDNTKTMTYDVAIVSEWDTLYGRALPDAFEAAACHAYPKDCDATSSSIHRFTYMRGIDGVLPGRKMETGKPDKNGKTASIEQPEGQGQKDYLRRLAADISDTDHSLRVEGKEGIRAIGILGSDVYDKLLILRVLRERFPKAVFFTTDLDAALVHPDQFPWTRNMIIASPYDFRFDETIQKNIPPFRDSYQASVFLSTRKVLQGMREGSRLFDSDILSDPIRGPAIFEIGRNGAIRLNGGNSNWFKFDWLFKTDFNTWARYLTALLFLAPLALLLWQRQNKVKKKHLRGMLRWAGVAVRMMSLFIFVMVFVSSGWNTDPFENFGIIAVDLLLFIAVLGYFYLDTWMIQRPWRQLSIRILLRSIREYRRHLDALDPPPLRVRPVRAKLWIVIYAGYRIMRALLSFLFRPLGYAKPLYLAVLIVTITAYYIVSDQNEPFSILQGISIWPTECLRLVAIWLTLFFMWRAWSHLQHLDMARPAETPAPEGSGVAKNHDIWHIWQAYRQGGSLRQRLKRIWLPVIIWLSICVLIFRVQSPNIPFRGEDAYQADRYISLLAIVVFIVLFGFIVDAALHCRQMIHKMTDYDTWWPFMTTKAEATKDKVRDLTDRAKREWHEIELIGTCTQFVSKMVYYPIYVILLLLAAQSDYFDNWDMPYTLMLISVVNIGITLWVAIILHRDAKAARSTSLGKLRRVEQEMLELDDDAQRDTATRQLTFYRTEIENIRKGAFLPISEQPWLRGMTLMFGGSGSLLLLQYLSG